MHPPTQGSITAPVSNSQPHADQPERQPERDSGHRAGDLELHGWFMLGTGAQEVGLPKFGTHHPPRMPPGNPQMGAGELSADRDTKATPYGLQSPKKQELAPFLANFHTVP